VAQNTDPFHATSLAKREDESVLEVQVIPSGDVATFAVEAELATAHQIDPFQITRNQLAKGKVRCVQVIPSGEVIATVPLSATAHQIEPFHSGLLQVFVILAVSNCRPVQVAPPSVEVKRLLEEEEDTREAMATTFPEVSPPTDHWLEAGNEFSEKDPVVPVDDIAADAVPFDNMTIDGI